MEKELEDKLDLVAKWIVNAKCVVALTGAGISTESGIPDYRGPEGVWTRRDKGLPPPAMKTPWEQVRPNSGHMALVDLMNLGRLQFLASQNVDGLHIMSGIPISMLAELHGNHNLWWCLDCHKKYTREEIGWDERRFGKGYRTDEILPGSPTCPDCGGIIRSSIINFRDPMPEEELSKSVKFAKQSDVFLSIGTSLQVTPASDLPRYALRAGAKFILINQGETPYDDVATIRIWDPIGQVLPPLVEKVKKILGTAVKKGGLNKSAIS